MFGIVSEFRIDVCDVVCLLSGVGPQNAIEVTNVHRKCQPLTFPAIEVTNIIENVWKKAGLHGIEQPGFFRRSLLRKLLIQVPKQ